MAFTYFFRDMHTLEHLTKAVIPHISGRSKVRFWDAGCAMGQEPFSLAIMFAENLGHFAFKNVHIDATDIDGSNLFEKFFTDGVYPEVEIKRIPKEIIKKYFSLNGKPGHFQISDSIRGHVSYRKHDLLSLEPVGDNYSLILCKNVLLHFSPSQRAEVVRMFHNSLGPGGFLATEQTQKLPAGTEHLFKQVTGDAQLFQKVEV